MVCFHRGFHRDLGGRCQSSLTRNPTAGQNIRAAGVYTHELCQAVVDCSKSEIAQEFRTSSHGDLGHLRHGDLARHLCLAGEGVEAVQIGLQWDCVICQRLADPGTRRTARTVMARDLHHAGAENECALGGHDLYSQYIHVVMMCDRRALRGDEVTPAMVAWESPA